MSEHVEVHTNAEWEAMVTRLDRTLTTVLDSALAAEKQLERWEPIIAAAVKLRIHWRNWDGTENMVPHIEVLAKAVDDATVTAVAAAIKKGEV